MLKFIEMAGKDKYGNCLVSCKCSFCGKTVTIRKSQFNSNNSCGCRKGHRHKNTYSRIGDWLFMFDHVGKFCLLDYEDFPLVSKWYWYQDSRGYWLHHIKRKEYVYLHKYVMGVTSKGTQVDHIFNKRWDNRKSRLRPCTPQENARNKVLPKRNKTGHVGVYETPNGNYYASVYKGGKEIRLGTVATLEEAVLLREKGAKEYYGEFGGGRYEY